MTEEAWQARMNRLKGIWGGLMYAEERIDVEDRLNNFCLNGDENHYDLWPNTMK